MSCSRSFLVKSSVTRGVGAGGFSGDKGPVFKVIEESRVVAALTDIFRSVFEKME